MRKKPETKRKKRPWLVALPVVAAVIALLLLDSRYRLTLTEFELRYENLPSSFEGFRIIQLSDLHSTQFGEDNQKLLEKIAALEPDIIVLTGDLINRADFQSFKGQAEELRAFLEELSKISQCFFVSGNHEWASGELSELSAVLEDAGIRYLKNEYIFFERGGERIVVAGVEDPNGPADMKQPDVLVSEINEKYPGSFVLFLGHRDFWLEKYPDLEVDLILAGHAHGGVVRLPFIGGVFSTEYAFFPKYDAGLYNEGAYDMILSRGLGNYNIIPRFLNPPEIVSVTLLPEN